MVNAFIAQSEIIGKEDCHLFVYVEFDVCRYDLNPELFL